MLARCLFNLFGAGVGQICGAHYELINVIGFEIGNVELEVPGGVALAAAGRRLGDTDLIFGAKDLDEGEAVIDSEIPWLEITMIGKAVDQG